MWSALNIFFVGVLIYFATNKFVNDKSDFVNFNNILTFSIVALTHLVVLLESVMTNKNFIKIWNNIYLSDSLIRTMIDGYENILNNFYKQKSMKILSYIFFTFSLELFIILNIKNDKDWTCMWLICVFSLTVSRLRHLQYTLFIDILSCRFQIIKNELKAIVVITKIESNQLIDRNLAFCEGLFNKINAIKKIYNVLWETSLLFNRTFGFSQITNFLQNFVQLTCDLYILYSFLYVNDLTYILGKWNTLQNKNELKL